jgi:CHAT domain-containing protein
MGYIRHFRLVAGACLVLFLSSTYWAMGQPNESNEHNRDLIESSEQDRIELMELKRRERLEREYLESLEREHIESPERDRIESMERERIELMERRRIELAQRVHGERLDRLERNGKISCLESLDESYAAFKDFLTTADRERLALDWKMRHGRYEPHDLVNSSFLEVAAERLVERIQANIEKLDATERTAAFLFSDRSQMGENGAMQHIYCSWLVTAHGVSAEHVILPSDSPSPAQFVQDGLGVATREADRVPVRFSERTAAATSSNNEMSTTKIREVLQRTSELIFPPAIKAAIVNQEIRRLLILAESDVSTIPFAALPIIEDKPLIDYASILILPDVGVLLSPKPIESHDLTKAKLIVGDPDFSAEKTWRIPPLPQAKAEAIEVARRFGTSALLGKAATGTAVVAQLRTARIDLAYFATHGLADDINPMDGSFLALTGRFLYGRDIKQLKLRSSPLVVMSACQTGLGKVFRGGVFGLARAWFFAGAPQIVMSLWSVADEPTKVLMVKVMDKVAERVPLERALQEAMRETKPLFPDPALWGGFAVYGQPSHFQ